jgi:hypothetical protein
VEPVRKDFFVSYTSADRAWAAWIAHVLEAAGYTVVFQEWDFRPGSNFVLEMQKALQSCRRMIAVLSPAFLAAKFPQPEWAGSFAGDPEGAKKALVPVMVERCEPDGLLSQVVQICIYDLDEDEAQKRLIEGVSPDRAKPTAAPPFPGRKSSPELAPAPFPNRQSASDRPSAGTSSGARLRWQRPPSAVEIIWRADLDDMLPNQSGSEAVELHLAFVGDEARLQMRDISALEGVLPDHGRRHGLFTRVEALAPHSDTSIARVTSAERRIGAGLVVTRTGQRSAWMPLPRGPIGALLDEDHLAGQLERMLQTLTTLDLPAADLVIPAVGFEPASMITVGKVDGPPHNSATIGHRMPQRVRPVHDDAIEFASIGSRLHEVATELAARLVAEHLTVSGLR